MSGPVVRGSFVQAVGPLLRVSTHMRRHRNDISPEIHVDFQCQTTVFSQNF